MKMRYLTLDNLVFDPAFLFKLTQIFADEEGTCLLYSGSSYETSQSSYLFLFPYEHIKIHGDIQQRVGIKGQVQQVYESNPWDALQILGKDIGQGEYCFPEWVGFLGYEMGAYSDADVEISHKKATTPEAYWQRCALTLKVDHATKVAVVQLVDQAEGLIHEKWENSFRQLSTKEGWQVLLESVLPPSDVPGFSRCESSSDTKEGYENKVEIAQEFIRSGDVYQLNLSQQWEFSSGVAPFDIFRRLTLLNPAPFAVFLNFKDFSIISSSPERFLQKNEDVLETRPIKGTAPRGKTVAEDENNKRNLLSSPKELAELTMITDLMRNDLGKISVNGSVEVPLLCGCEAYQNVFHLYSIVRSRVLPQLSPLQILRACFPGGSITGCPKLRAMELIAELEQRPRGIYTGSIGYFSHNGDFDFNIAIRTLVMSHNSVNVQLGGGIVIDSNPQKEYEETLHKGRSIFEVLNVQSFLSQMFQK